MEPAELIFTMIGTTIVILGGVAGLLAFALRRMDRKFDNMDRRLERIENDTSKLKTDVAIIQAMMTNAGWRFQGPELRVKEKE